MTVEQSVKILESASINQLSALRGIVTDIIHGGSRNRIDEGLVTAVLQNDIVQDFLLDASIEDLKDWLIAIRIELQCRFERQ